MNIDFLKEVLSVPSVSGDETMVKDFIIEFAVKNNIDYYLDTKGNLYLTKGELSEGEYYPCVVSHVDTVHRSHTTLIENKELLVIKEDNGTLTAYHPTTNEQTGIGGDDKCGVYVCLELFHKFDTLKGAFFVEEEIGMRGSREADDKFFTNVGYAIQFDAPSSNWITEYCFGVKLFDSEFKDNIKSVLNESGYTKFSTDPFTDVNQLVTKYDFNCLNLGCGYYRQHTNHEYVVVSEVSDSLIAGEKLIAHLGNKKYTNKKVIVESKKGTSNSVSYSYDPYFDEDYDDDYIDHISEEIVDMILDLTTYGANKKEIIKEVKSYLEDIV